MLTASANSWLERDHPMAKQYHPFPRGMESVLSVKNNRIFSIAVRVLVVAVYSPLPLNHILATDKKYRNAHARSFPITLGKVFALNVTLLLAFANVAFPSRVAGGTRAGSAANEAKNTSTIIGKRCRTPIERNVRASWTGSSSHKAPLDTSRYRV